jgi:hypothetical protein
VASKLFTVNEIDAAKSAITLAIGEVITVGGDAICAILKTGKLPTQHELTTAAIFGLAAGLASITRRFFSGPKN